MIKKIIEDIENIKADFLTYKSTKEQKDRIIPRANKILAKAKEQLTIQKKLWRWNKEARIFFENGRKKSFEELGKSLQQKQGNFIINHKIGNSRISKLN